MIKAFLVPCALFILFSHHCPGADQDPGAASPKTGGPFALGSFFLDENSEERVLGYGDYPHMDGSPVCAGLARAFAREHLGLAEEDLNGFVQFSGTESAIYDLVEGTGLAYSHLPSADVSMEPSPPNLALVVDPEDGAFAVANERGVDLIDEPIACDALVFFAHPKNPVDNLGLAQAREIYAGNISNWRELGGWDSPIAAYQDSEKSGGEGLDFLKRLVMKGVAPAKPPTVQQRMRAGVGDGGSYVVEFVERYRNTPSSIGFGFLSQTSRRGDVKILSVEGVRPDADAVRSGTYPLAVACRAVLRAEDRDGAPGKFLDWILSDAGQRCVENAGFAAVSEGKVEAHIPQGGDNGP